MRKIGAVELDKLLIDSGIEGPVTEGEAHRRVYGVDHALNARNRVVDELALVLRLKQGDARA